MRLRTEAQYDEDPTTDPCRQVNLDVTIIDMVHKRSGWPSAEGTLSEFAAMDGAVGRWFPGRTDPGLSLPGIRWGTF